MKNALTLMLFLLFAGGTLQAQDKLPTMQQSTSTPNTRQSNPAKPRVKPVNPNQNREVPRDTASRSGRRRLRPDSLRRGGAVRVDTIR
ncbi:MAG: hypothetical protein LH609_10040 [Rudanella sp.]|nr:hypothetical protein [Rudanella sp.]